jgi:hypothetical protein
VGPILSEWQTFATIAGGASAALTGLLFVAVSINTDRIAPRRDLRSIAGATLAILLVPLFIAIVTVIPGQPRWLLATEIGVVGVFLAIAMVALRVDDSLAPSRLSRVLSIVTPSKTTPALVVIGAITYGAGAGGGLYWLIPAVLAAFLGGVFNAWVLLIRLPVERPDSGQSPGSPGET